MFKLCPGATTMAGQEYRCGVTSLKYFNFPKDRLKTAIDKFEKFKLRSLSTTSEANKESKSYLSSFK